MKRLDRLIQANPPGVAFWFPCYWRSGRVLELRKLVGWINWRQSSSVKLKLGFIFKLIVWPLIAFISIWVVLSRYSANATQLSGKDRFTQLLDLFRLSVIYGFAPLEYYSRRIYLETDWQLLDSMLSNFENKILCAWINSDDEQENVKHKLRFAQVCEEAGVASIPVVASFENGALCPRAGWQGELPRRSLYFKPSLGQQSKGLERWEYQENQEVWSFGDSVKNSEVLLEHFLKMSLDEDYILQAALHNHSSLRQLSLGGLIGFRIVTVYDRVHEPEVIASYLGLPRGSLISNSSSEGGIRAFIDTKSGVTGLAYAKKPQPAVYEKHPDTGALIAGFRFEHLDDVFSLAQQGHKAFPGMFVIGWDVAYTDDGACIIEGNTLWGSRPQYFAGTTVFVDRYLDLIQREPKMDPRSSQS